MLSVAQILELHPLMKVFRILLLLKPVIEAQRTREQMDALMQDSAPEYRQHYSINKARLMKVSFIQFGLMVKFICLTYKIVLFHSSMMANMLLFWITSTSMSLLVGYRVVSLYASAPLFGYKMLCDAIWHKSPALCERYYIVVSTDLKDVLMRSKH